MELKKFVKKFYSEFGGKAELARKMSVSNQNFYRLMNKDCIKYVIAVGGLLRVVKVVHDIKETEAGEFIKMNFKDNLKHLDSKQIKSIYSMLNSESKKRGGNMAKEYDLQITINDSYNKDVEPERIESFLKRIHVVANDHDLDISYFLKAEEK